MLDFSKCPDCGWMVTQYVLVEGDKLYPDRVSCTHCGLFMVNTNSKFARDEKKFADELKRDVERYWKSVGGKPKPKRIGRPRKRSNEPERKVCPEKQAESDRLITEHLERMAKIKANKKLRVKKECIHCGDVVISKEGLGVCQDCYREINLGQFMIHDTPLFANRNPHHEPEFLPKQAPYRLLNWENRSFYGERIWWE